MGTPSYPGEKSGGGSQAVTKKKKGSAVGGFTYRPVETEPTPHRAWLEAGWRRPGPPKEIAPGSRVRFSPDYLADLPVWGVDWQNPQLSCELLKLLVDWQEVFDDHGQGEWPPDDWEPWVAEGKRLAVLVQRELGPSVVLEVGWPLNF
jgi:hypothetical protein